LVRRPDAADDPADDGELRCFVAKGGRRDGTGFLKKVVDDHALARERMFDKPIVGV
jgi:hypothetical protein